METVHDLTEGSFGADGVKVKSALFKNKLRSDQVGDSYTE